MLLNDSGQWRYRIGDYRLTAQIQEDRGIMLILTIGHRKNVYNI
ncbi:type II toxin-antitoxin system RelE family toxin [Emergencia sp.]